MKYVLLPGIVVLALIAGGVILYKGTLDPEHAFRSSEEDWRHCFDDKVINIALLGFDRNEARDRYYRIYRPDTIMIASLNLRRASVALLSIPRDSYVEIHGAGGYDKINHAYMYGHDRPGAADPHRSGIDTVLKTIEDFLGGVPVHYYAVLDMDGAAGIIDKLGGLYYDVDVEVRAKMGRGRLLLEKGYQHLDGKKFLRYLRDRASGGDLGRTQRQQKAIIEAFRQLRGQGRLRELPGIYRTLTEAVETNLSFRQLTALALWGVKIEPDTITTHVFAGEMQYAPRGKIDALNYWVIDEQARVNLIEKIFGVAVSGRSQITLPGPRRPVKPISEEAEARPEPSLEVLLPSDHRSALP